MRSARETCESDARRRELLMTRASGFTLIEVLIALVVLSVGLLGLASLQTNTLAFNHGAYVRSQATALSYDIVDRMRANRDAALDGAYHQPNLPDPAPACNMAVAGASVADRDISAWRRALACALPLGNGAIDADDRFVTITVEWDEPPRGDGNLERFEMRTSL